MKPIISALAAAALFAPGASANVRETLETVDRYTPGSGVHPIARILLFPLMPFVELQATLSPDKASCFNDRADEVVGCAVVDAYEDAVANRPTPYVD